MVFLTKFGRSGFEFANTWFRNNYLIFLVSICDINYYQFNSIILDLKFPINFFKSYFVLHFCWYIYIQPLKCETSVIKRRLFWCFRSMRSYDFTWDGNLGGFFPFLSLLFYLFYLYSIQSHCYLCWLIDNFEIFFPLINNIR